MKKIFAYFLCVLMLSASVFSFTVGAAGEADRIAAASKWDGTVYTVESEDGIYKFEGEGKKSNPYLINSAEDLAKFAANVRYPDATTNYSGKYFKLTCDIDIDNKEWWGIGGCSTSKGYEDTSNNLKMFEGSFDGQGHVVYNFNLADSDKDGKVLFLNGLFGFVGGGSISNIGIASGNITLTNTSRCAALVGASRFDLDLENCFNKANINYVINADAKELELRVGGLVGIAMNDNVAERNIVNCYNTGNITITQTNAGAKGAVGGILGYVSDGTSTYENCYNTGNITMTTNSTVSAGDGTSLGGIIGSIAWGTDQTQHNFKNCSVGGSVSYTNTDSASEFVPYIGVFTGYSHGLRIVKVEGTNTYSTTRLPSGEISVAGIVTSVPTNPNNHYDANVEEYAKVTAVQTAVTVPLAEGDDYFIVKVAVTPPADNSGDEQNKEPEPETETEAVVEDIATDAEEQTTEESKGGCGSFMGVGALALCAAAGAFITVAKKKKND